MKILPPAGAERRRQLARLAIILAVLAGVIWYQWPPAAPAPPTSNVPAAARQPSGPAVTLPEPVRLAVLEEAPADTAVRRNPFTFGARAAPQAVAFSAPPVTFAPAPLEPQGPPPIALRLTGLMVSPGTDRMLATFKDPASGALFHAFEGDVVDGRYRVVKVGNQSVVVSYVDGSGLRTLGLGN